MVTSWGSGLHHKKLGEGCNSAPNDPVTALDWLRDASLHPCTMQHIPTWILCPNSLSTGINPIYRSDRASSPASNPSTEPHSFTGQEKTSWTWPCLSHLPLFSPHLLSHTWPPLMLKCFVTRPRCFTPQRLGLYLCPHPKTFCLPLPHSSKWTENGRLFWFLQAD